MGVSFHKYFCLRAVDKNSSVMTNRPSIVRRVIPDSHASRACNATAWWMHIRLEVKISPLYSGANDTLSQPYSLLGFGIVAARPLESVLHDESRQVQEPIL
jgi:hypothetical protein